MHWEQELRDDTPLPLESSFDHHALNRFADYANLYIPAVPKQDQANWILEQHLDTRVDFKCRVITTFVAQVCQIVNTHAPGIPLGIDIVPAHQQDRERLLGQHLPKLARYADYLSPMLYHHILSKSSARIIDILDEFANETVNSCHSCKLIA